MSKAVVNLPSVSIHTYNSCSSMPSAWESSKNFSVLPRTNHHITGWTTHVRANVFHPQEYQRTTDELDKSNRAVVSRIANHAIIVRLR